MITHFIHWRGRAVGELFRRAPTGDLKTSRKPIRSRITSSHILDQASHEGNIMGPKRKHQDPEPQEAVHASRQFQVYGNNPKPVKKPRRTEPPIYKKQAHASSVNAIKKRMRDVTRKLERSEDLPANVRIEDERALGAYQQELAAAEAEKIRQKMIKRYHMVRFFGTRTISSAHFFSILILCSFQNVKRQLDN